MMGPNAFTAARSLRRDQSVKSAKVAKGTARRILSFVHPYRRLLALFLAIVVVDAVVGAANPLLYREIIDKGILGGDAALIVWLALLVAGLAIADAALTLVQRYISSLVGEGLIYDMRTKVFDHVQRMPLAFFTRTQTGALVSRLNNDVTGAQEAFTDVLSTVIGNLISVAIVLVIMFFLSWQLTLVSLILLPVFLLPARWLGRKLQAITRERYELMADMNTTMVERFNVSGALLVKLFGHPAVEDEAFRQHAGRVRDIGVTQSLYARFFYISLFLTAAIATALVYGWGGVLAVHGTLAVGTVVALTAYLNRLYGPLTALSNINVDIMTALVSFERVFEVLDLPPMVAEKPDAKPLRRGPARIEFDHVAFTLSHQRRGLAGFARVGGRARRGAVGRGAARHELHRRARAAGRPRRAFRRRQDDDEPAGAAPVRRELGRGAHQRHGRARRHPRLAARGRRRRHSGRAPLPRHGARQPALRAAGARRTRTCTRRCATPRSCRSSSRCRRVSRRSSATAATGSRAARSSAWRIARLLLKAPDIVVLDEATAHLDSESERAVQQALKTALAGRTSLVIAHRLSTVRDADQILVVRDGRIAERGRHEELLAAGGLYAELYRTQFRDQGSPDGRGRDAVPDEEERVVA